MKKAYRVTEVSKIVGVSETTIWRWTKKGLFPKPKKLGRRVTVWTKDSIDNYLQ